MDELNYDVEELMEENELEEEIIGEVEEVEINVEDEEVEVEDEVDTEYEDYENLVKNEADITVDGMIKDEIDTKGKKDSNNKEESSFIDETDDDGSIDRYDGGIDTDSKKLIDNKIENIYDDNDTFISDTGDVVVMDMTNDLNDAFELKYIDISNIIIVKAIRKARNINPMIRSIKSTGLLSPVIVGLTATEGVYVLLNGFRRLLGCAKAGKKIIPCVINKKINTKDIPVVSAMYNKHTPYTMDEVVDYIDYLEKEKGILNASMIEYLLNMESGDYTKLKDILTDNDDEIVGKLYAGIFNIEQAFKKLEQRRRKETAEERADKQAAAVYNDKDESGISQIDGTGEQSDEEPLSEEQIKNLTVDATKLDDDLKESSISSMIEKDNNIAGFAPHKQKTGEREYIDPAIRKATLARDNFTCACCKRGGEQYVDILDFHHIIPVFLGGVDSIDNGIMLCVACHRLVHLYSTGDLHINNALLESSYDNIGEEDKLRYPNEQIYEDEQMRFKRIIKLGGVIRNRIAAKGMSREQYKKEHSNAGIGRRKPGVNAQQEKA